MAEEEFTLEELQELGDEEFSLEDLQAMEAPTPFAPTIKEISPTLSPPTQGPLTLDQTIEQTKQEIRGNENLGRLVTGIGEAAAAGLSAIPAARASSALLQAGRPVLSKLARAAVPVLSSLGESFAGEGAELVGAPQQPFGERFSGALTANLLGEAAGLPINVIRSRRAAKLADAIKPGAIVSKFGENKRALLRDIGQLQDIEATEGLLADSGFFYGNKFNPKTMSFDLPKSSAPTDLKPFGFDTEDLAKNSEEALKALRAKRAETLSSLDKLAKGMASDPRVGERAGIQMGDVEEALLSIQERLNKRKSSYLGEMGESITELEGKLSDIRRKFDSSPFGLTFKEAQQYIDNLRDIERGMGVYDMNKVGKLVMGQAPKEQLAGGVAGSDLRDSLKDLIHGMQGAMSVKGQQLKELAMAGDPTIPQDLVSLATQVVPQDLDRTNSLMHGLLSWKPVFEEEAITAILAARPDPVTGLMRSQGRAAGVTARVVNYLQDIAKSKELIAQERRNSIVGGIHEVLANRTRGVSTPARSLEGVVGFLSAQVGDPVARNTIISTMRNVLSARNAEAMMLPEDRLLDALSDEEISASIAETARQSSGLIDQALGPSPIPGVQSYFDNKIIDPKERETFRPILGKIESHKTRAKALSAFNKDGTVIPEVLYEFGWDDSLQMPAKLSGPSAQLSASEPAPTVTTVADGLKRMDYDY